MEKIIISEKEISLVPFSEYTEQVAKGVSILNELVKIESTTALQNSQIGLQKGKQLISLIDKQVETICRPLKDMKKEIDDVQRKVKEAAEETYRPILEVVKIVESSIIDFNRKQQEEAARIRKENEEKMRQAENERLEAEKKQKELEKDAAEKNLPPPPPMEQPKVEVLTFTAAPIPEKIKGLVSVWKYEITDVSLLPKEYLIPDTAKITAVVKAGIREIPGCRIFEEQIIRKS